MEEGCLCISEKNSFSRMRAHTYRETLPRQRHREVAYRGPFHPVKHLSLHPDMRNPVLHERKTGSLGLRGGNYLSLDFRSLPAANFTLLEALILIFSPVFGLM